MSVATALARARVRSTSTTSPATPRITSANAHAEPTLPAPMTPTFMATPFLRVCMEAPAGTHLIAPLSGRHAKMHSRSTMVSAKWTLHGCASRAEMKEASGCGELAGILKHAVPESRVAGARPGDSFRHDAASKEKSDEPVQAT